MGTRADFYVQRGDELVAEDWIGSIAWDGYPPAIPDDVKQATNEADYRAALDRFYVGREDVTRPDDGWPWPWKNSGTTDYAYVLKDKRVDASCFGSPWFAAVADEPEHEEMAKVQMPDMTHLQRVTFGKRSGVIVVGG